MNWTEIYRHALPFTEITAVVFKNDSPPEYVVPPGVKPCRIIPCPGSYFPCHDDQCEMEWDEEAGYHTDCQCEPRARARLTKPI